MQDFTTTFGNSVAEAAPVERAAFIRRTYTLLALAIVAFIAVEAFFFYDADRGCDIQCDRDRGDRLVIGSRPVHGRIISRQ